MNLEIGRRYSRLEKKDQKAVLFIISFVILLDFLTYVHLCFNTNINNLKYILSILLQDKLFVTYFIGVSTKIMPSFLIVFDEFFIQNFLF